MAADYGVAADYDLTGPDEFGSAGSGDFDLPGTGDLGQVGSGDYGSGDYGSGDYGPAGTGLTGAGDYGSPGTGDLGTAGVGDYGSPAGRRRSSGEYSPGASASAWADRGGSAGDGLPPKDKPSRRHAAPDTGTDIARFGISDPSADAYDPTTAYESAEGYSNTGYGYEATDYAAGGGYNSTDGFGTVDGYDQAADSGAYAYEAADELSGAYTGFTEGGESAEAGEDHDQPAQPTPGVYGRRATEDRMDRYGPDPMAAQNGWGAPEPDEYGRW